MTREEAISWIEKIIEKYIHGGDDEFDSKREEALRMAISALEQDKLWVSQETVLDQLNQSINILEATDRIKELPSVTQKSGKWITDRCDMYICSKCNHTYTDISGERYGMNFCPNCGAKMESEE